MGGCRSAASGPLDPAGRSNRGPRGAFVLPSRPRAIGIVEVVLVRVGVLLVHLPGDVGLIQALALAPPPSLPGAVPGTAGTGRG